MTEKEAVITELETRSALQESNISLNEAQENQVNAMANKLIADTNLTEKIQEMDYGGALGKNISQNILDVLTGNAGISGWNYLQIAAGITSLTYLKSAKAIVPAVNKAKAGITAGIAGAIAKLKALLKKKPKPKKAPVDYTKGHRMDRQSAWDDISRRRNMGVNR
jgi:uncharacterized coiled-coil protein SlyX